MLEYLNIMLLSTKVNQSVGEFEGKSRIQEVGTSPGYGNLLWFSAVLTDAELSPDEKLRYDICDVCKKCVAVCPSRILDIQQEVDALAPVAGTRFPAGRSMLTPYKAAGVDGRFNCA